MAEELTLTPEQEAAYWQAAGRPKPTAPAVQEFDPFKELDADGLAKLAVDDPEHFDVTSSYYHATKENPELLKDQKLVQTVADATQALEDRGFQPSDIPGVPAMAHMAKDVAVGLGQNIWNLVSGTVIGGVANLVEKRYGKGIVGEESLGGPLAVEITRALAGDIKQEQQRKVAESWAGTETSITGMQQQAGRAVKKVIGKAQEVATGLPGTFGMMGIKTPTTSEERVKKLFGKIGELQAIEAASAGKGPFMQTVGGHVIKELEEAGKPIRPEEVSKVAAGDFFTFWAYGKAFHGISRLEPVYKKLAGVTGLSEATGGKLTEAFGTTVRGAGEVTKLGAQAAEAVAKVAPAAGFVAGGIKGAAVGGELIGGPSSAIGGAALGYKGGQMLKKAIEGGAKVTTKVGDKIVNWGSQVAGDLPVVSNTAQLARDVIQITPASMVDVGRGFAMDVGLAAVTSESPQETAGAVGIGTFFGGLAGAKRFAGHVTSGLLIGPRAYAESKTVVPTSGDFKALDQMHADALRIAPPGIALRVNAIRAFIKGWAPNVEAFLGDKEMMQEALTKSGMAPDQAKLFSDQKGFFMADLPVPGKPGETRRIIGFTDVDSAPHESAHAFQDVLGESGNRALDEIIKRDYSYIWDALGESYSKRFKQYDGSGWREFLLDVSGWGITKAKEKLLRTKAEQIAGDGAWVDPASTVDLVAADWRAAVDQARAANPGIPEGEVISKAWRGILDAAETREVSDRYLAREVGAEAFDALFKHLGPKMKELSGLLPKVARVVGSFMQLIGGEPLHGRVSEVGQFPLRSETIQATKEALRGRMGPEVTPLPPSGVGPGPKPTITPPGSSDVPGTPEERKQTAEQAQAIAAEASPDIPAGAAVGAQSPREIAGVVATSIASGEGVRYQYHGAPGEKLAADPRARDAKRRAEVEAARNIPNSVRELFERSGFPYRIEKNGSALQVLDWAPDLLASNAMRWSKALAQLDQNHPIFKKLPDFDHAAGEWTATGWETIFAAAEQFSKNQLAGFTGAGEAVVVPAHVIDKGFQKPMLSGEPAVSMDQNTADFINTLYSIKLPMSGKVGRGKPLSWAGQQIAAEAGRQVGLPELQTFKGKRAEDIGVSGQSIKEVNPLRAEMIDALKARGVSAPDTIPVVRRLNLSRIHSVEPEPLLRKTVGSVTLTTAAGFQPQAAEGGARRQFNPEAEDLRPLALRPGGGQRRITITGPDGKTYNARFDGYQEIYAEVNGKIEKTGYDAQITPEVRLPFQAEGTTRSTTYQSAIEKAGFKIAEPLPTVEQWETSRESEPLTGQFNPRELVTPADEQRMIMSKVRFTDGTLKPMFHATVAEYPLGEMVVEGFRAHFGAPSAAAGRVLGPDAMRVEGADGPDRPARTVPVFLNIENPIRLNDAGTWGDASAVALELKQAFKDKLPGRFSLAQVAERVNARAQAELENLKSEGFDWREDTGDPESISGDVESLAYKMANEGELYAMQLFLESKGYDGVVYQNAFERPPTIHGERFRSEADYDYGFDSYIPFHNDQIISPMDKKRVAQFSPKGKSEEEKPNRKIIPGIRFEGRDPRDERLRLPGPPGSQPIMAIKEGFANASRERNEYIAWLRKVKKMSSYEAKAEADKLKGQFSPERAGDAIPEDRNERREFAATTKLPELLKQLADDTDPLVVAAVAANESTPFIALEKLAKGSNNATVLRNLINNSSSTDWVLQTIAHNPGANYEIWADAGAQLWRKRRDRDMQSGISGRQHPDIDYGFDPTGEPPAQFSPPKEKYADAEKLAGNPYVKRDAGTDNSDRTLLVQISSNLLNAGQIGAGDAAVQYYDKLYSGVRTGYERPTDFWEIPQWIGFAAHTFPNSDVYVVRDVAQAKEFLKTAGYGRVAMSALEVNKAVIKDLARGYEGQIDVGGYVNPKTFDDSPNINWHDSLKSMAESAGVEYKTGVDYSHFADSSVIPRLQLSEGCKYKCAFCDVVKTVTETPDAVIDQQVDAISQLGSALVYVNDKTFGQAENYTKLPELGRRIAEKNPNFKGFIVQTTAAQLLKIPDAFLKEAGIKFVELGIESYNDPILRSVQKPATEAIINTAVDKLRQAGIALIPNIIIGMPGETAETYARTLQFLKDNKDIISHANIYNLALYSDTTLAKQVLTLSAADYNENVLEKSFHTNPEVHKQFAGDLYGLANSMLEAKPKSVQFSPEGVKPGEEDIPAREPAGGANIIPTFNAGIGAGHNAEERQFLRLVQGDTGAEAMLDFKMMELGTVRYLDWLTKEMGLSDEQAADRAKAIKQAIKEGRQVLPEDQPPLKGKPRGQFQPEARDGTIDELDERTFAAQFSPRKKKPEKDKPVVVPGITLRGATLRERQVVPDVGQEEPLSAYSRYSAPIMSLKGRDWVRYKEWLIDGFIRKGISRAGAVERAKEAVKQKQIELGLNPDEEGQTGTQRQFQPEAPAPGDEPVVEPKNKGIPTLATGLFGDMPMMEFKEEGGLVRYKEWLIAEKGKTEEEAAEIIQDRLRGQMQPPGPEVQMQPAQTRADAEAAKFLSGRGSFLPPNRLEEESRKLLAARGTFKRQDDELMFAAAGRAGGRPRPAVEFMPRRRVDEEAKKLLNLRGTTSKERRPGERAEEPVPERSLATPEEVRRFFREEQDYAILTATREAVGDAFAEENRRSNDRLFEELEKRGYKPIIPVGGTYKGKDQGENFLVLGIKPQEALALGQKYGQESVVVKQGLLHSADESVIPSRLEDIVVGPEAAQQDYFSTLPNKISFAIPFDFEAERAQAQYMPKPRVQKKDDMTFIGARAGKISKAWILPDGTIAQLGPEWHHAWLDSNKDVQAKYGLQIPPFEGGDTAGVRETALKKGFVRLNLVNGSLVAEARERDFRTVRPILEDLIEQNINSIDRFRVTLLNDKVDRVTKSYDAQLFNLDTRKQKMAKVYETFSDDAQRELSGQMQPQPDNPRAIKWPAVRFVDVEGRKWEFSAPRHAEAEQKLVDAVGFTPDYNAVEDGFVTYGGAFLDRQAAYKRAVETGQYKQKTRDRESLIAEETSGMAPRQDVQYQPRAEQEQLFGGRELLSTDALSKMNRKELKEHFPEAIVPANLKEGLPSRITESPLHKQSDDPVGAFADKLVEFAKQYEDDPLFQSGKRWYSEFTPLLKKYFGKDAPLMAELLAATSPQTNPTVNFGYALDALEGIKSGRFRRIIAKFNQGMERLNDGSWEKSADTPARFMADWVEKYDLKPKQSNGKLYGQHSRAVLQVFARIWLEQNKGPKTRNFVENLLGTSDEATIDLWADRTMRRLGYEGLQERWRIMPQNGTGVSDVDFEFSQRAFRAAADQLGIKPSELQGALWFAEKSLWNERGWARLDLGDYRREIARTELLQQGVKHRTATLKARERTRQAEEIELPLVEKRKLK